MSQPCQRETSLGSGGVTSKIGTQNSASGKVEGIGGKSAVASFEGSSKGGGTASSAAPSGGVQTNATSGGSSTVGGATDGTTLTGQTATGGSGTVPATAGGATTNKPPIGSGGSSRTQTGAAGASGAEATTFACGTSRCKGREQYCLERRAVDGTVAYECQYVASYCSGGVNCKCIASMCSMPRAGTCEGDQSSGITFAYSGS